MPWDGSGNFNRTDGTRTGTTVWSDAASASVKILSNDHDTHDEDIADGLENCVAKDGQTTATSDLPMGTNRHTGVANANARDTYASAADVQDGNVVYAAAGGSSSDYTLTLSPAITAYTAGQRFIFKANHVSDDTCTLNVNGLGAKTIKDSEGNTLFEECIQTDQIVDVTYDGTDFRIPGPRSTPWVDISSGVTYSSQPGSSTYTSVTTSAAEYRVSGGTIEMIFQSVGTYTQNAATVEVRVDYNHPANYAFETTADLMVAAQLNDAGSTRSGFGLIHSGDEIDFRRFDNAAFTSGTLTVRTTFCMKIN